jgi:magnesium-transporting ATPase (P-type)
VRAIQRKQTACSPSDFNWTMEERMSEGRSSELVKLLYSIDAFLAGLLFIIAILLALFSEPSILLGALTDLSLHFSHDNRTFGFPVAVTMLLIAIWRSRRIYRSRVITRSRQFGLGFCACFLVLFKLYLFFLALDRAMRKLW